LIDATSRWTKLRKNLGSKNREISEADRAEIVKIYDAFTDGEQSKILEPADFGYWEITVEQPLRLRFEVTDDTLEAAMAAKAVTKLSDDEQTIVRAGLESLRGQTWLSRDEFIKALRLALKNAGQAFGAPVVKAIWQAIGEHDDDAEMCTDNKGNVEPNTDLRDTELVPFRDTIDAYFEREVKPHVPDAWIDTTKTKIGYEIPFTRLFYRYVPPRPLAEIDAELEALGKEIIALLSEVEG